MISFLIHLCIPDADNITSPKVREAYGSLCSFVGIFLNLILFAGKFLAGVLSHSIAITADAINNLSDAGSSLITLVGFKMAGKKPDPGHPFGHGRIEYISGLIVSLAILMMAVELLKSSFDKVLHPVVTECSPLILAILFASILVKFYMTFYNRRIAAKIDSAAMKATAADSLSDAVSTTVVLFCTVIVNYTGLMIDGYCGMLVGLFILYSGIGALRETISPLLGEPPSPEFIESIQNIVMSYDTVHGIHDLIVHNYGPGRVMISLHAEVPATGNILELHDVIDNIEMELRQKLQCDAVIHMDPINTNDPETLALKEHTGALLQTLDYIQSFHDFRVVKGESHTNLIFDVLVEPDCKFSDEEITDSIQTLVHENDSHYFAVLNVDRAYC
ncbi:MAG: cation diffusion facilitator family transporter [Lachnospiraceae bacterium]|nr:cation diffusion facilitator family transporter [Lachnospiraceae bacterium]